MLCGCHSSMDRQQFEELPTSTNAVESYNRFGKHTHRQPLKVAMMATYKEDMAETLEIMARRQGLTTSYDNQSTSACAKHSSQQNRARQKRLRSENDDPEGPPDTKRKFFPGNYFCIIYNHTMV